jgi:hypothetical protein
MDPANFLLLTPLAKVVTRASDWNGSFMSLIGIITQKF